MKKSNVIPFPKKKPRAPPFEEVSVLLSSLESRKLEAGEAKELGRAMDAKIGMLEGDLAKNGKALRDAVESYVRTMASDRPDELAGSGIAFMDRKEPKRVLVGLESGEASRKGSEKKIDAIVEGCSEAAKEDLAFLKEAAAKVKGERRLPADQLSRLKEILERNSYWRLLQIT